MDDICFVYTYQFYSMVSAFSVPKATRQQKYSSVPGPGQYNPQNSPKYVKKSDPLYSFGKGVRRFQSNPVPGPGAYQPKQNLITDKKPSFSMLSRRELSQSKLDVGPGQYTPGYVFSKEKSPAFSIRGKFHEKSEYIPGPGQYEYKSNIVNKQKGYDFGKENRSKIQDNKVPGPGAYQYQNAVFKYGSKQEPKYGFGSRIAYDTQGSVPGPGTYQPKKDIFSHIGGIFGKDLRDSLVLSKTPGPGNYQQNASLKEKAPKWSLSKSTRDSRPNQKFNIGPGQYQPTAGFKKIVENAPAYNFGGKSQKLQYDISDVPGPGSYERQTLKSRRSIKIGQKWKDLQIMNVPGPGAYQQFKYDNQSWLKGRGRYSVAKDSRIKESQSLVPGPGAYENKSTQIKSSKGKVTFGHDSRLKHEESKVPGPGYYDLKPKFADVPKYLLPNN